MTLQTFLPFPDFAASAKALDPRRLGKQRVEALQVLNALAAAREGRPYGWLRHPCVRMWRGHEALLGGYLDAAIDEWERRGFRNAMPRRRAMAMRDSALPPWWWGYERLHASHRSNLLRKDPAHYGRFGWKEPPDLPKLGPWKPRGAGA